MAKKVITPKFSYILGPSIVVAMGMMTIASAQSPFANKKKTQAWETPQTPQPAAPSSLRRLTPPPTVSAQGAPISPTTQPNWAAQTLPSSGDYPTSAHKPRVYGGETITASPSTPTVATQSQLAGSAYKPSNPAHSAPGAYNYQPPQQTYGTQQPYNTPQNYSGQGQYQPPSTPSYNQSGYQGQSQPSQQSQPTYAGQNYPPQTYSGQPYPSQTYGSSVPPQGPLRPKSWKEKLGLSNLVTSFKGFIKGGAAAVNRDDGTNSSWNEEFVGDAKAAFEVSAVTDTGYEYGVNLEGRAQYDPFRRGFGGRVPDCPPTVSGCSSFDLNGTPTGLRGHTSRFYATGVDDNKDAQYALESAHIFLRSSYGDITVGRDDGAAYLFSLGAPSLLAVAASNSSVDYTGLDSVKTVNDASGFSEKITYTSPRLLGDTVGVGIQFGASYALNARACGVDYCVKSDDVVGTLSPELEDIIELGVSLDRTLANGIKLEATASYATGSEQSQLAAFDDLQAYNFGAEMSWADITLGGSFLKSNNGLMAGDYTAWDIGTTWKPSALGFTLGYGQAKDDNIKLSSDQIVAGLTYDFNKFTVGAGAQYIERETLGVLGSVATPQKEKATALFIEGGFTF